MAKSINYKGTLQKYGRSHFYDLRFEEKGSELLSKLLSDINSELMKKMEQLSEAEPKISSNMYHRCAKKAVESILVGSSKDLALSEALRQLALHESGCLKFGDITSPAMLPNRRLTQKEKLAQTQFKQTQKFINRFRLGVMKFSEANAQSFTLDKAGGNTLGLRIYTFAKLVADAAASSYAKKEELEFTDIKTILPKYLGKDVVRVANAEGSKWLVLYENGLLEFKAKREIVSEWSKSDVTREKVFISVFLPSVKKQLKEASKDSAMDSKAPKFLGHTLMDVAGYLAQKASEVCEKRKAVEMGPDNLRETISLALPEQLRQLALVKASEDVQQYNDGHYVYERRPEVPKRTRTKDPRKTNGTKGRRVKHTKNVKRPSQKKRKNKDSHHGGNNAKRMRTQPLRKKPGSINFGPAVTDLASNVFQNEDLMLARDTKTHLCNLLDDACEALASHSVSVADSKEIGVTEMKAAVNKVFPQILQELADSYGSYVLDCWKDQGNAEQKDP